MNFVFWGLMLLMLLVAIVIIVFPLVRARKSEAAIAYKDSNVVLYEAKLAELDLDLAESRIDEEHYRVARKELDRELLDNVPEENASTASEHYVAPAKRRPVLAIAIAVFVPAMVLGMYSYMGLEVVQDKSSQQMAQPAKQPSVQAMAAKLVDYLQTHKGTAVQWTMLGRAYKYEKNYKEAIKAFDHALKLEPNNSQLMLETAEAIALLNGENFNPAAYELVMQAKKIDPDNINVLWFAGVAEYQQGHYRACIDNLSRLAAVAKVDKEVDKSVRFYMTKARDRLLAKGEIVASLDKLLEVNSKSVPVPESIMAQQAGTQQTTGSKQNASSNVALHVAVSVSPEIRSKFSPDTTVFVYAKAASGPPMPLAVQRLTLSSLPTQVKLDDSMAMMAGMNLSAFPDVVVSARISRSGSAIAQSGDYIGEQQVKDVRSAKGIINIKINKVVP